MPQTMLGRGNELYDWVIQVPTLTWSQATLSSATSELTATIQGLQVGDIIAGMSLPNGAMTTSLSYSNIRVSAANTMAVTWVSAASSLTIPTGPWNINVLRLENPSNLPTTAG